MAMAMRWTTALVLAIVIAAPARGAKWEGGCPKVRQRLSKVGKNLGGGTPYAISRYFEHVGHELTFYLRDYDVLRYGGFSTEPDGNTVETTFTPIGGDPIPLPPITVTAVTPSALTFVVPDSRPALGRLVAGPARFVVKRGTTLLFDAFRQIILPPMNDVHEVAEEGAAVEVLAAMDAAGRLWIPLSFTDFGTGGSSLPECPTELTPVTAFAIDFSLKKSDDEAIPYVSFGQLKKNRLFLGDYLLFGLNMYGNKLQSKLDVSPTNGKGVLMCAKNDAIQLVVMVGLTNPAVGDRSELLELARDGSPLVVKIENISTDPEVVPYLESATYDSFSLPCYPAE
jgi:hypothetical protein